MDFRVMGSEARVVLDSDAPGTRSALEGIAAWLLRCEHVLTRFDASSALCQLNERGFAANVDQVLWAMIDAALLAAVATEGLVTPTALGALEAAGYDRSFDVLDRDQAAPPSPSHVPDWRGIERDEPTRSIRLPPGVRLDLGGTAKGWCADAAAAKLSLLGPALVDLGGDIATSASPRFRWPIAVEDPRGRRDPIDLVLLRRGGVATSGRNVHRWKRAGTSQHHVIDPRTGAPARTDVLTASVVAPSAFEAELAAKRVLLEGSEVGLSWVEGRPELAAVVVSDDGRVLRSRRFVNHLGSSAA